MLIKSILILVLVVCTIQVQVRTHQGVQWLSKLGNRWSGALNECNDQCLKAGGEVCA